MNNNVGHEEQISSVVNDENEIKSSQENDTEIYSDHLPQFFDLTTHGVPLKILSYNIDSDGSAHGYGVNQVLARPKITSNKENDAYDKRRFERILFGIKAMVSKHDIDVVALQEEPASFGGKGLDEQRAWFETLTGLKLQGLSDGKCILYNPEKFTVSHVKPASEYCRQVGQVVLTEKITDKLNNLACRINIVHLIHQGCSAKYEKLIDFLHKEKKMPTITVGDFNCGTLPDQLSGIVPPIFTGRKFAYDFTDGCVLSTDDQTSQWVEGKSLNSKTGENYRFNESKFTEQPASHRYRALIQPNPLLRTGNEQLAKYFPDVTMDIFDAYDIQTGDKVKGFSFPSGSVVPGYFLEMEKKQNATTDFDHFFWSKNDTIPTKVYFIRQEHLAELKNYIDKEQNTVNTQALFQSNASNKDATEHEFLKNSLTYSAD